MNTTPLKISTLVCFLMLGSFQASASSCQVIIEFYQKTLEDSVSKIDKKAFYREQKEIKQNQGLCEETIALMKSSNTYNVNTGYPIKLSLLNQSLIKNAEFKVNIIERKGNTEIIEFDTDTISALRKRPTR